MGTLAGSFEAGKLRKRVHLLSYEAGKDFSGGPKNIFEKLAEVSSAVEVKSAKESEVLSKETGITNTVFTIRHRTGIDTKNKLSYNKKLYNILGITELGGRKSYLKLITEQIEIIAGDEANNSTYIDNNGESIIDNDGNVWIWE